MIRNSENLEVNVSRMVGKSKGAIVARKRDTEASSIEHLNLSNNWVPQIQHIVGIVLVTEDTIAEANYLGIRKGRKCSIKGDMKPSNIGQCAAAIANDSKQFIQW